MLLYVDTFQCLNKSTLLISWYFMWSDRRWKNITKVRRFESVKTSVHAVVTSRVDYCNSVLSLRRRRSWTSCSMFKMLQHVWSQGPGNMSVVCHGRCTTTCTGWLFLSECSTCLLWQSIVVFGTELQCTSPTAVCQFLKFLVASICDLPDVISCQFHEFAVAPLGPVNFLSPDQQSGIHCLIICRIQLLTSNNSGGTWRRIYLFTAYSKR